MTPFEQALDYTFKNEGGFSNDKNDAGGATQFGITRDDASRWLHRPVSVEEMKHLSKDVAKSIYEAWYWKPVGSDQIVHAGVAICLFDIGVVRGIGVPPRYAQKICNNYGAKLVEDGHIGPRTIAAVNSANPAVFIRDFSHMASNGFMAIVAANPSQRVFLNGWLNRARRLLTLI